MFKSKIALGNKNFLGNKDRKKLAVTIKSTFNLDSDEQVEEILDKENTCICKVQKTKITIYLSKNIPVLFTIKNDIFPTVYTLWKYPHMIPCFVIYPPASEFLMKGADLMIPGICKEVDNVEGLKVGSVWGVRVFNNPHLFAVGQCSVDYDSNNYFYDLKGKCLKVVHIFNDELWKLGSQTVPHSSFQAKIIDSVENVVDNFDEFKVYDENKGMKKKKAPAGGQQRGAKEKLGSDRNGGSDAHLADNPQDDKSHDDNSQHDSLPDESPCDDDRYRAFTDDESEQEKSNGEGGPSGQNEPKPKSTTSEKSLDNFYKHFAVILAQRSHTKIDAHPTGSKNAKEGKKQPVTETQFKEQDLPSETKKDCTVGMDSMEESSHQVDAPQEDKTSDQKKHCFDGNPVTDQGKRGQINKAVENRTHRDTDLMNEWDEFSGEENAQNGEDDNKRVSIEKTQKRSESKEARYDDQRTVSEASFVQESNANMPHERNEKNTFELNREQQDALLMYLFLEVAQSLSDDNLPLEVSGVYSRMTREFSYIHRNESFLGELQKLGIPTSITDKIKAKEVNLELDVKKSTYKKISKFIQHCSKLKLIKIKENRNVISVVNIRKSSSMISSYKPMSLEEKKRYQLEGGQNDAAAEKNGAQCNPNSAHQKKSVENDTTNDATDEATNKGAQVLEFYMPSSKGINIFKCVDSRSERSSYYNIMELKDVLKSYVQKQKLVSGKDPQLVKLNDDLRAILNVPCESSTMSYESLLSQFISTQLPCYAIIKPYANFDIDPIKVTKGKCPSIHIYAVARMKGKKYVTHITNLFLFHVDLNRFTEHVQKQLACSCSIVISTSTKKEEVLVQGNVVNMIHEILIKNYNIPRKYIELNSK
ncbi:hypothetical protein C922_01512 [Plasmodium inui San Antonio 1]|uniref:SUI1 domain-containing protein n=1 Tax=Plasmodium inui San Antonio 1 TaxID=1237626 RepID=W7A888_9APIC|nr:hypothetical protein C922_01512 [Plasmodium inui San Antonio 1]EUD67900.1 hypothetical protein C922_01512 [Plasmodium inui San Antonio 1]